MGEAMAHAEQVLTFGVGGRAFAIEASAVAEVVPAPPVTRVPQAPPGVKGVANLRGRVLPILALDRVLDGLAPAVGSRLIVLGGDAPVGLAVDTIGAMQAFGAHAGEAEKAELVDTEAGPARLLRLEPLIAEAFGGVRARRGESRRAAAQAAPAPDAAAKTLAFLEFRLASQAYATPLAEVREVSAIPAQLQALPGNDAAMAGLVTLRDRLLPVISGTAVLGLQARAPDAGARILVLEVGDSEAGLMVEAVCGVLRTTADRVGAVPALLNRSAGEARIESVVRAPDRLISILPARRILDEATIARWLAEGAGRQARREATEEGGAMQRILLFRLGEETYGLPIELVEAVIQLPASVTRVPKAPPFVVGVTNHRGRVVPLVDQAMRFDAGAAPGARRRVVVASLEGVTAGFIVDAVDQIVSVPDAQLQPAPELAAGEGGVFDRVASIEHDGRLVLMVDPRRLLDQAERDLVRALAEAAAAS